MRVNLEGMITQAAKCLRETPGMWSGMYAGSLEELLGHIKATVAGEHTLDEFAEFYCLKDKAG